MYKQVGTGQRFFFLTVGYDGLLHSFPAASTPTTGGMATRGKVSARFSGEGSRQENKPRTTVEASFAGQGAREIKND
jgi:hypothetical protein